MNERQQYIILRSFEKVLKEAIKDVGAEVKADLVEQNDGEGISVNVSIGDAKAKLALVCPTGKELVGMGDEFLQFMRDHGMTHETVNEDWKRCVTVSGRHVIWEETGEYVPGVVVQIVNKASYVKPTMDAQGVLMAARDCGLLDASTIELLEGADGN